MKKNRQLIVVTFLCCVCSCTKDDAPKSQQPNPPKEDPLPSNQNVGQQDEEPTTEPTITEGPDGVSFQYGENEIFVISKEQNDLRPPDISDAQWGNFIGNYLLFVSDNIPINFYGKFVDQDGNPLEGVLVDFEIDSNEVDLKKALERKDLRAEDNKQKVVTGKDGLFSITNEKGFTLRILKLEKSGFQIQGKSFRTVYFTPGKAKPEDKTTKTDPMVFTMKKVEE